METDDLALLRGYACDGDDAAFARLVRRHNAWVFAAARRRLEDDHLADDATQAVFIVLSTKTRQLVDAETRSLAGWLFQVTHFTCSRLRRTRSRQRRHESVIATLRREDRAVAPLEAELVTLLDDAIAQLPAIDREAVVRRFYGGDDLGTIGEALGLSAEATRKRISRALVTVRSLMLRDGIDAIPDNLLAATDLSSTGDRRPTRSIDDDRRINSIAKGTMTMLAQTEAIDFAAMSAEFFVTDVEANLDFFEKLGFRRHWMDTPDAMGRLPRASLRGGQFARIWLRRASETDNTRPAPGGATLFYWINAGPDALAAHRNSIAAQGVAVSPFFDDIGLRNFTVTTPDGYSIGFFTAR